MPRPSPITASLIIAVTLCVTAITAQAQAFSFRSGPQAVQTLSVGYVLIDFEFDGEATPLFSFNFDQPAYGLVYSRPHFLVTAALGNQDADDTGREDLRLIDVSLTTWGELRLLGEAMGATNVFIPIVLHGSHRRVESRGIADSALDGFNVSVLGLGVGLGLGHPFGERVYFEARINPVFGLATSSLTDAIGTSRLLDADVQLHVARLFGRLGLSLGYTFRGQVWNVNASDIFPDLTDDLFDYKGQQHVFRVGVNW